MNQALHIFKKDTRRFWMEILASFAALAIYVVHYPGRWSGSYPAFGHDPNDSSMMYVVVVAWWLLIGRVIHAESPVGESQFWITRPYERKSLLAAKALFIGVWVYVPFVAAQMAVLSEAGFSPVGHASGWGLMVALYSGVFIVPLVAIAALTANFGRMTLVVFGVCVAAIGWTTWVTDHSDARPVGLYSQGYGTLVPYAHYFLVVWLAIAGGAMIVVLQYAVRRVWVWRAVAIGVVILLASVGLALSKMPQREVERQFPAGDTGALRLAFAPSPSNAMWVAMSKYEARVQFPIALDGVAEGGAVEVDDIQFSMDAADGSHWSGPWRRLQTPPVPFQSGLHAPALPFILSRADYERFKSGPVTLHVALAVTELRAGLESTAMIASPAFAVPGFGVCSADIEGEDGRMLLCRSEFGELPLAYVTAAYSDEPCSGPQPPKSPAEERSFGVFTGEAYADPIAAAFDPVRVRYFESFAYDMFGHVHGTMGRVLCAGTIVHVTHYDVVRRSRAYLTVANYQLPLENQRWVTK